MAINWTMLFKQYNGLWIALKDDEKTVIASGRTARIVWDKAQKKGYKKPILTRMPEQLISYIGTGT